MGDKSGIQWTDATWNPVTGCSKVSQGCKNCYALRDWARLAAPRAKLNAYTGREFTDVRFHPERLDQPFRWRRPRRVFVNSMSDLFHENMEHHEIEKVFGVMGACPQHTFQILTKRPERMRELLTDAAFCEMAWLEAEQHTHAEMQWPFPNVLLGVSVEDQATADERIPLLLDTPAARRFISAEPLLGPIHFYLRENCSICGCIESSHPQPAPFPHTYRDDVHPDWVIVGGESGPGARPCDVAWIRSTVEQCRVAGVACFVKQLGARPFEQVPSIHQIGSAGALAAINERRAHIPGWTLTHTVDGKSVFFRSLSLCDRKGGDPAEWPADLRVREMPDDRP